LLPFIPFRNVSRQRKRIAILRLAMPSNNMLFNLVHNPGEISATVIEKPGQFFVRANIVVSTNNAIAPGNDPCFLFLHCTKSE
jgi:hypothetical protein